MFAFLSRLKLSYVIYNFFKKKELVYNESHYKRLGLKKRYYSTVSSEDFKHLPNQLPTYDIENSRELLPKKEAFKAVRPEFQESLLAWSENGYAILPSFLSEDQVDEVNSIIEGLKKENKAKTRVDSRIMFAIHQSKYLYNIGESQELKNILNLLLDKPVDLFQSINFQVGSQQKSHSDSIHMSTYPLGNMIAAWVALEDIGPDQGPLHYYPGSHKLPYLMNADYNNLGGKWMLGENGYSEYEKAIDAEVSSGKFEKQVFHAKKGDMLIWHANLIHGGEAVNKVGSSRKSMVFHYYAQDAVCYHEITQRPSLKKPSPFI